MEFKWLSLAWQCIILDILVEMYKTMMVANKEACKKLYLQHDSWNKIWIKLDNSIAWFLYKLEVYMFKIKSSNPSMSDSYNGMLFNYNQELRKRASSTKMNLLKVLTSFLVMEVVMVVMWLVVEIRKTVYKVKIEVMVINKTVVDLGTFIESLDLTPSFDPCEGSAKESSVQWELIKAKHYYLYFLHQVLIWKSLFILKLKNENVPETAASIGPARKTCKIRKFVHLQILEQLLLAGMMKAKVFKMLLVLVAQQQLMETKVFKMGKQVVEVAKWMLQIRAESFFGFRSVTAKIGWN